MEPTPERRRAHRIAMPHHAHRVPRPGNVTVPWTTAFWVGWLLVAGGFAAVWFSSRTTGLSTWWLGPESSPSVWFHLLPFIAPITLGILAVRSTRHLPWYGVGGAVVTALIAVGDFGRVDRYALIELALAGAGLCVSVATFAGMLRAADHADDGDDDGDGDTDDTSRSDEITRPDAATAPADPGIPTGTSTGIPAGTSTGTSAGELLGG